MGFYVNLGQGMNCRPRAASLTPTAYPFIPHKKGLGWVLPPLSNSWMIFIVWLYIALNRTPNIDCYWVGAVPKV